MSEYPGWDLSLRHEFESKGTYPSDPQTLDIDSHMISVREVAMMYIMDRLLTEMTGIKSYLMKNIFYSGAETC